MMNYIIMVLIVINLILSIVVATTANMTIGAILLASIVIEVCLYSAFNEDERKV